VKPGPAPRFCRIALALGSVAIVVSACSSEPSAKRVAEDLINTLAATDEERDCMFEIVDEGYSEGELDQLGRDVNEGDAAEKAAAQVQLDQLSARLSACVPSP
jgi:predicted secreted protein